MVAAGITGFSMDRRIARSRIVSSDNLTSGLTRCGADGAAAGCDAGVSGAADILCCNAMKASGAERRQRERIGASRSQPWS